MSYKRLLSRLQAREKILHGASALADAVRVTLGARWSRPASSIPPKWCASALENAVSVAGVLLLTEATLAEIPEPKSDAPPRCRSNEEMRMTTFRWWPAALLAGALCVSPAAADEAPAGRALYLRYCSACHGSDGKGDGIAATVMRPKPTDLTLLSKTHGGQFPRALVAHSIDGRQRLAAHGETDMPVWGQIFAEEKGSTLTAQGEVRGQVQLITDYLRTIQAP